MVGFLTFLFIVVVLRISTRYLPGCRPRLISYLPSLLIAPPPPGPGVPSIGSSAIDPSPSNCPSNRTVPVTVVSDSRRNQGTSPTHPRTSNPPAASQTHRASLTVETPCHDDATRNEGVQPSPDTAVRGLLRNDLAPGDRPHRLPGPQADVLGTAVDGPGGLDEVSPLSVPARRD